LCFLTVSVLAWCFCHGIVESPNADDRDILEFDGEHSLLAEEVYANFSVRKKAWIFLRKPESGPRAFYFMFFVNKTIILSLAVMAVFSVRRIHMALPGLLELFEWYFLVVFTMEWMAIVKFSASWRKCLRSWMTYFDVLAVVPSYMDVVFGPDCIWHSEKINMLLLLRLLRMLRVLRMAKLWFNSQKIEIVRRALVDALPSVVFWAAIMATVIFLPGVLMFHIEQGVWSESDGCYRRQYDDGALEEGCSPFQDIPTSMYWSVTTVTTVGYGDATPISYLGKVVCGCSMVLGVLSIAVPVGMITSSFTSVMETMKEEDALKQLKRQRRRERDAEGLAASCDEEGG